MKTLCKILLFLSLSSLAANEPLRRPTFNRNIFMDPDISIDKPINSQPMPWIYVQMGGGTGFETGYRSTFFASCGHLFVVDRCREDNNNCNTEAFDFSCRFSPIAFDFNNREIIVFVDLVKKSKEGDQIMSRLIQTIGGETIDYLKDLQEFQSVGDKKIDSLATVLGRLSQLNTTFGQTRFNEGTLRLKRRSPMKFDPLTVGLKAPLNFVSYAAFSTGTKDGLINSVHMTKFNPFLKKKFGNRLTEAGIMEYSYFGTDDPVVEPIKLLGQSLEKTLDILWTGYEKLKINSNEENQKVFVQLLIQNAKTISAELQDCLKQMREKTFHPLELVWMTNQLGDLTQAIDSIIKNEAGSGPGFVEILSESRN